jgi:hypothetical protein
MLGRNDCLWVLPSVSHYNRRVSQKVYSNGGPRVLIAVDVLEKMWFNF